MLIILILMITSSPSVLRGRTRTRLRRKVPLTPSKSQLPRMSLNLCLTVALRVEWIMSSLTLRPWRVLKSIGVDVTLSAPAVKDDEVETTSGPFWWLPKKWHHKHPKAYVCSILTPEDEAKGVVLSVSSSFSSFIP